MARMAVSDVQTPPIPNFQMSDYEFPTLHYNGSPLGTPSITSAATSLEQLYGLTSGGPTRPPPGLSPFANFTPGGVVRNLEPAVAKPHVLLHHQYLQWTTMMLSLV